MTIDEVIKHCEEMAEYKENSAIWVYNKPNYEECMKSASDHRQLVEWLRELEALKDFANFVAESVTEEEFEENSGFYAEVFCRKLHKMGFIEATGDKWIFNKEEDEE